MKIRYFFPFLAGILFLGACGKNDATYMLSFNFFSDTQGWTGDFADYPLGEEDFYELDTGWAHLPVPLDTIMGSFRISGNNHSDDLFMFIKYKMDGLLPGEKYSITFEVELASDAPTNGVGIGGAPGEGVTLKVGAVQGQPDKLLGDNDFYIMNLDKGNQSSSGEDMIAVGHVGVSDTTTVYTLIKRDNNSQPVQVIADENGECWFVIGTDSGFEGKTTLYYSKVKLMIKRE
jgi:hypothetical protein